MQLTFNASVDPDTTDDEWVVNGHPIVIQCCQDGSYCVVEQVGAGYRFGENHDTLGGAKDEVESIILGEAHR